MPFDTVYSHSNPRIRKITDEMRARAVALYEQGWTYKQIADDLGVSQSGVVYHVTRRTVLHRDRTPEQRAARVGDRPRERYRRLTAEQRDAAVRRIQDGETYRVVADDYGVTPAAIAHHVRRAGQGVA